MHGPINSRMGCCRICHNKVIQVWDSRWHPVLWVYLGVEAKRLKMFMSGEMSDNRTLKWQTRKEAKCNFYNIFILLFVNSICCLTHHSHMVDIPSLCLVGFNSYVLIFFHFSNDHQMLKRILWMQNLYNYDNFITLSLLVYMSRVFFFQYPP